MEKNKLRLAALGKYWDGSYQGHKGDTYLLFEAFDVYQRKALITVFFYWAI